MDNLERMNDMLYSPVDLARMIMELSLRNQEQLGFLENVWDLEASFLPKSYRYNKDQLISDTKLCLRFLDSPDDYKKEYEFIRQSIKEKSRTLSLPSPEKLKHYEEDEFFLFKKIRLQLLFLNEGKNSIRMQRGTLLRKLGYEMMSRWLEKFIEDCVWFYHLQTSVGGEICPIKDAYGDDMLVFKVL
ncbi:MAG: hypothetical protein IKR48_03910 [Kiritimatiellae bacterium]|nr:hypothetical protein [Kiritimatiellia bacterium]